MSAFAAQLPQVQLREVPQAFLHALSVRFAQRCSTASSVCAQHGRDESSFTHIPAPSAVIFAESAQDVADALRLANEWRVPVIPYGVGSSLEGHLLAVHGGISLDLSRMDQILSFNGEDLTITVQPGVTREAVNAAVRDQGLFFPIDPGANATIGGMCATRASGTNAVRYATMKENVLALEVVTADGSLVRTGTRARKSSAGYDLTRLMVGSEGTLGVITEITLRLYPLPESIMAATCSFPSVDAAVATTQDIIQMGVPIARCELLDSRSVAAVNRYSKLGLPESAMLLMEFHGSAQSVNEQIEVVQALATEHDGEGFQWAQTPESRTRLWAARHHAFFAALQSRPGCVAITTDACVPISKLAQAVTQAVAEADQAELPYFLVGHVGDGNFHMGYLIDPASSHERQVAEDLNSKLVHRAIQVGGTCTGEHGIGLHKREFLAIEAGSAAMNLMKTIKQALDPHNILNPGKIFMS